VPTFVIGFAAPSLQAGLDAIADAGCEPGCDQNGCRDTAIMVDNETDLVGAFAEIIQGAVLTEICNGQDDDCDGLVDEDFPGLGDPCCDPCAGTVVCTPTGLDTMCSGVPPCPEICDMEDNDCDGLVDEFLNCVYEVCNGLDDDGDGETDELPLPGLGAPCGSDEGECERGVTCCAQSGNFACCGAKAPKREICDCLDNNCNTHTDENISARCYDGPPSECPDPDSGTCVGICRPGNQLCITDNCPTPTLGPCFGQVGPREEICNCLDDDCNGLTDDDVVCSNGAPCLGCNCASPCDPSDEFPCPVGRICSGNCGGEEPYFCMPDPCLGVHCESGFACQNCTGECLDLCAGVECGEQVCCGGWCCEDWEACEMQDDGMLACVDASCTNDRLGCPEGQVCENHHCVSDPCEDVRCAEDEACRDGQCLAVCPVCNADERCEEGRCVPDECAGVECSLANMICCEGRCNYDPCVAEIECSAGEYCNGCAASCEEDLCRITNCPSGYECRRGECQPRIAPDTAEVAVTGAGGCACRMSPVPAPPGMVVGVLMFAWRARGRRGRG